MTHIWRSPGDKVEGASVPAFDYGPQVQEVARALQEAKRRLDNVEGHGHGDLEDKIAHVQDALAETVAASLREARCAQAKAHDELKAAFTELATRLAALKEDHKDVTKDIVNHGDSIVNHDEQINTLTTDIEALVSRIATVETKAPEVHMVESDVKPMPIWPLVCLIILWLADIALRFVPIK